MMKSCTEGHMRQLAECQGTQAYGLTDLLMSRRAWGGQSHDMMQVFDQVSKGPHQKGSFKGGPLGKRAKFLPMLDMNSPKNEPPLKIGTPRLVGSVHLQSDALVSTAKTKAATKLSRMLREHRDLTLGSPAQRLEGLF